MPTIAVQNGYHISLYSHDLPEPMRVHVFRDGHECKVWLDNLSTAFNYGFEPSEIAEICRIVLERRDQIVGLWLVHGRGSEGVAGITLRAPPKLKAVSMDDKSLSYDLADGRFIRAPLRFYPTLALAAPEERSRFEINGSSVYWPELDADIGVEGLLAGAREHLYYVRQAVERAVRLGRLPADALQKAASTFLAPA